MTSSDFDRAFEDVFYRSRPAWHVIGGNRERLIAACIDWARDHAGTAAHRATWVLDRLLPLDEIEVFRRLNSRGRWLGTLYPLFRRAPEEMATITPERFDSGEGFAAAAAWVETRVTDDELLGWHAECLRRGWRGPDCDTLAVVEYCRRSPDANRLLAYLESAPPQEAPVILDRLVRLAAPSVPRTAAMEPGLAARLRAAGFGALATAIVTWTERPPHQPPLTSSFEGYVVGKPRVSALESSLALALWTEQQGPQDADRLASTPHCFVAHRLATIVPNDRGDIWERAFAISPFPDDFLIRALCQWCTRAQRDLLLPHFDPAATGTRRPKLPTGPGGEDAEHFVAALRVRELTCASYAFHTYLALSTPEELARLAEDRARPAWQVESLDRWMHAPKELRPLLPRALAPTEIVFDLRELDPFDVRFREATDT